MKIGLLCGRNAARLLLYPITLYFFLRRGPERRASRAFFERAQGHPATSWQVLKHIHYFASTILDRVFLLSEAFRRFDVRVHGLDQLDAEMARGRGVMLLGAHMGSFEVLRALGTANHVDVGLVMYEDNARMRSMHRRRTRSSRCAARLA